mmetsp:Transcript_100092/g.139071  ORF Transcript_100092/g.139071 Transcript_100092/m.139071 type:complete len:209 (+) Transcript_100092:260-886(+)
MSFCDASERRPRRVRRPARHPQVGLGHHREPSVVLVPWALREEVHLRWAWAQAQAWAPLEWARQEWAHREWALPAWEARPWGWECLGSRSCKHRFNGRRVLCHLGKCLSAQAAPARRECLARAPCQAKECHQVPGQKECLARAPKATGRCRTPPELCFGQSVARTMALISDNDCLDNRVACPGPSVLAEVALTGPVCTGHGRLTKTTS